MEKEKQKEEEKITEPVNVTLLCCMKQMSKFNNNI